MIREPSIGEIVDQFEIRFAQERYVLQTLSGHLSDEQVERVRHNLSLLQATVQDGDLARHIDFDGQFLLLFCEFLGNREILRAMSRLGEKLSRVAWLVSCKQPERMKPSTEEHVRIAEAVIRGKPEEALDRLKKHMEQGKRALINAS